MRALLLEIARKNPKLQENTYYYINFHWFLFLKHFSLSDWKKNQPNKQQGSEKPQNIATEYWTKNSQIKYIIWYYSKSSTEISKNSRASQTLPGSKITCIEPGHCPMLWDTRVGAGRGRGADGWGSPEQSVALGAEPCSDRAGQHSCPGAGEGATKARGCLKNKIKKLQWGQSLQPFNPLPRANRPPSYMDSSLNVSRINVEKLTDGISALSHSQDLCYLLTCKIFFRTSTRLLLKHWAKPWESSSHKHLLKENFSAKSEQEP